MDSPFKKNGFKSIAWYFLAPKKLLSDNRYSFICLSNVP